jgi:trehalose 6-phosphate synthase
VLAIPIGADFDRIREILSEDNLAIEMATLSRELDLQGRLVGIGVDRLDYTKGIPERIAAVARLLRERPDLQRRLLFLQVGVPSREDVPGYAEISAEIDCLVAKVNLEFGRSADDGPIRYFKQGFALQQLVALYRLADFCVVSSLHDGMNLVAKEFVAARDDEQGVLILSSFAGASRELADALIVNPYDAHAMSEAIHRALSMPEGEQRARMRVMRDVVRARNFYRWAGRMLLDAAQLRKRQEIMVMTSRTRSETSAPRRSRVARLLVSR